MATTSVETSTSEKTVTPSPNLSDTRKMITDLYNQINKTYVDLVNSGRVNEAASLRDASERLSRSGSEIGLSGFARSQAIKEIQDKMRVNSMQVESANEAKKIAQQLETLNVLAGLDEASFNQQMQSFRAKETQRLEDQERADQADAESKATAAASRATSILRRDKQRVSPVSPVPVQARVSNLPSAQDQFNERAIEGFLRQRDESNRRSNPFYQAQGPISTSAQAKYAVAQANMGQQPGLFRDRPKAPSPTILTAPQSPLSVAPSPGQVGSMTGYIAPSAGRSPVAGGYAGTYGSYGARPAVVSPISSGKPKKTTNPVIGRSRMFQMS